MKNCEKWLLPWGMVFLAWMQIRGSWLDHHYGKWIGLQLLGLIGMGFFLFERPVFPALRKWEAFGLGALVLLTLGHLFWFRPSGYEFSLGERLGFFFLVLVAWRSFVSGRLEWKDFWWPLGIGLLGVSGLGIWQVATVPYITDTFYRAHGSTFGYTNNTAQAVGILLLAWWGLERRKGMPATLLLFTSSALSLAYLVFSRGRSALLAFALGFLVLAFFRWKKQRLAIRPRTLAVAGILLVSVAALYGGFERAKGKSLQDIAGFSLFREKGPLTSYRADVWLQTLKMIRDKPLGVGVDRFGFEFVPYHREGHTLSYLSMAISPHNEFLRYPAEDGIPLSLFFAGTLFWLIRGWWRAGAPRKELLAPLGAFYLVEMVAQFPWQNPFPSFFGALVFGFMAAEGWRAKPLPTHAWAKGAGALLLLLFAFNLAKVTASRLFEKSPDVFWAKVSCRAVPSNWQGCLNYSRVLLERGETSVSRRELERMLEDEPWNYGAIRHLAVVALRQGDALEACFHTWRYNDIFKGKSDLQEQYEKNCPEKWRSYFERKRPKRYYRR